MDENKPRNGHDKDEDREGEGDEDNVIRIPTLAERDRMAREERQKSGHGPRRPKGPHDDEPLINLPPVTKKLCILILAGFLIPWGLGATGFQEPGLHILNYFSFMPARFSGEMPFLITTILTPVTYTFLHGGWMHLILNTAMLVAFGTGVERWMGGRNMLSLFLASSVAGAGLHFLLDYETASYMIGASGGISGLFAGVLVMLRHTMRQGRSGQAPSLLPFIILWVVISLAFGAMGGPGGSSIAWAGHLGGFFFGLAMMKFWFRAL